MTKTIKTFAKRGIATAAIGAMALASATPALAQNYDHDDNDGISAGDVIAGAVILGGIAVLAGAIGGDDDDRYYNNDRNYNDGRYYNNNRGDRYAGRGNPRQAVAQCVSVARNEARRYGYRQARVTEIRNVNDTRYGWRVKGQIVVDDGYRGGRYDRNRRGGDRGRFTCDVQRGRVTGLDFNNIRGLG